MVLKRWRAAFSAAAGPGLFFFSFFSFSPFSAPAFIEEGLNVITFSRCTGNAPGVDSEGGGISPGEPGGWEVVVVTPGGGGKLEESEARGVLPKEVLKSGGASTATTAEIGGGGISPV
jgi:hypothetical protein